MAVAYHRPPVDRTTLVQAILGVFARSPIFCEAVVSEPVAGHGNEVAVDVSFGRGPTAFRVVARSEEEAYAILYELATAMVEVDGSQRAVC